MKNYYVIVSQLRTKTSLVTKDLFITMNSVVPIIYLLISSLGVVGNIFVILVLRKVTCKSITDFLVQNLAIADLIFTGVLPFWAIEKFENGIWRFGSFLCQFIR